MVTWALLVMDICVKPRRAHFFFFASTRDPGIRPYVSANQRTSLVFFLCNSKRNCQYQCSISLQLNTLVSLRRQKATLYVNLGLSQTTFSRPSRPPPPLPTHTHTHTHNALLVVIQQVAFAISNQDGTSPIETWTLKNPTGKQWTVNSLNIQLYWELV